MSLNDIPADSAEHPVDSGGVTIALDEPVVDSGGVPITVDESAVDPVDVPVTLDESAIDSGGVSITLSDSAIDLNTPPILTVVCPSTPNNAERRPKRLNALPGDLFSMVCDSMDWNSHPERTGLLSLRRTCRNSYEKSEFTMSRLFPLTITWFSLEASSLAVFLSLSSKPRFARYMEMVYIVSDRPSTHPKEYEDEYSPVRTEEAALILAQCFRNLQGTLRWLIPTLRPGQWLAPHQTEERQYRLGLDPLQVAFVTKDVDVLQIATARAYQNFGYLGFLRWEDENEFLYSWFIKELHYPFLVNLCLSGLLYISGSQFCKFLERHSATLSTFHASMTALMDGSWTDVFTELRKLPRIKHVGFRKLYQKKVVKEDIVLPNNHHVLPFDHEICSNQVKAFLDEMITYHKLYNGYWSLAHPTHYWQVVIFNVPSLSM
ncbi:hypothetical protein PtrSN002B_002659 [Pyrenophora tritici-repentis]|nr:hypothetical protein Alg130_06588 [Pyrenophora tritici-repentis]KAI0622147.1 hypothetical protein TUN199_05852 [Pyrenophora tritici-repentis]KAI1555853.1 hypothetical protein PtrSN002B_002659 [Pyrenophora tritici-repentis]KAI1578616.1 hypothetical protein PtrEW7m1_005520 [Pyrenophora tritici-repentis]KAI1590347.1 hypothetical protein PtrEW13061_005513 [Pyrenophora tritici-repentis]